MALHYINVDDFSRTFPKLFLEKLLYKSFSKNSPGMMEKQFTNRAREAIEAAMQIAKTINTDKIIPEMLLKALLEKPNALSKLISSDDIDQIKIILTSEINKVWRSNNTQEPQFSKELYSVIQKAQNEAGDFVSVDILIKICLDNLLKTNSFKEKQDILKNAISAIAKEISSKKYDGPNSDNPEDAMSKYAVEMVQEARDNKFDPVIGRDSEIRQIIEILAKKTKSNVIMVGKPGVGKTAIVNGIAQLIAKNEARSLEGYKIYNVDVGSMVAGSELRGAFEKRLTELIKEAENNDNVILFIDEIHMVLGAGGTQGSMDAANILKPGLAAGKIKCIGATTFDEYRKYITKDPAFERRFVKVNIREPSVEDSITILRGIREKLETHHGIKISDSALVYAATVAKKYIANRRLPDIAIDLVDTACASLIITLNSEPQEIQELKNKLWSVELEKTSVEMDLARAQQMPSGPADGGSSTQAIQQQLDLINQKIKKIQSEITPLQEQFFADRKYLIEAKELKQKMEEAKIKMEEARRLNDRYAVLDIQNNVIPIYENRLKQLSNVEIIEPFHIAEVISRLSGIPVSKLRVKENERLLEIGSNIKMQIFGQDEAVNVIVSSILSSRVGLGDENKPIGSFLFVGPTGVGKTELSKAICKELNDTCENMVVLDMSDYSSEISINKLIGAPAGYMGCEEGGALTEPIKEMPYNVVLLDEVDLAHQRNLNILYQLLDEGRVIDGRGVKVSFRNTVVIMTTNLGQQYIKPDEVDYESIQSTCIQRFGHALVNRIDNLVVFKHLTPEALRQIFFKEIDQLNLKLKEKSIKFGISGVVLEHAISQAISSNFGGRVLKRFVKDNFISGITHIILTKQTEDPITVICHMGFENVAGVAVGQCTYVIQN